MIKNFPKEAIDRISSYYPLTENDAGEYHNFKSGAMKIKIDWYYAQGLGNVCALRASAMLGLMKMYTLVINPFGKNAPLFSFDYIIAMGKHTLLLELYDTAQSKDPSLEKPMAALLSVKSGIAEVPDHDLGQHWYDDMKLSPSFAKRTGKANALKLDNAADEYLDRYLSLCGAAELAVGENNKVAGYVDGLFQHGGPSTDAFKKELGEEKTRDLFERIVFHTKIS